MQKPTMAPPLRSIGEGRRSAPIRNAKIRMIPTAIDERVQRQLSLYRDCPIISLMSSRSSRNRLDLAIVFGVAVVANFVYLYFSNGDFYYPDSFTYLAPAR